LKLSCHGINGEEEMEEISFTRRSHLAKITKALPIAVAGLPI
jgi:hypothetical protein